MEIVSHNFLFMLESCKHARNGFKCFSGGLSYLFCLVAGHIDIIMCVLFRCISPAYLFFPYFASLFCVGHGNEKTCHGSEDLCTVFNKE